MCLRLDPRHAALDVGQHDLDARAVAPRPHRAPAVDMWLPNGSMTASPTRLNIRSGDTARRLDRQRRGAPLIRARARDISLDWRKPRTVLLRCESRRLQLCPSDPAVGSMLLEQQDVLDLGRGITTIKRGLSPLTIVMSVKKPSKAHHPDSSSNTFRAAPTLVTNRIRGPPRSALGNVVSAATPATKLLGCMCSSKTMVQGWLAGVSPGPHSAGTSPMWRPVTGQARLGFV